MWFDSRPQKLPTMNMATAPCSSSVGHGGEEKKEKERGGDARGRRGRARVRAEAHGVGFMEGEKKDKATATVASTDTSCFSSRTKNTIGSALLGWLAGGFGLGPTRLAKTFFLIVLFLFCVLVCKTNPFAIILFEKNSFL